MASKVWAKTIGGGGSAYGHSACQATDGGYIIAGKKELESADDYDICLIKTNGDTLAWRMTFCTLGTLNKEDVL